MHKGKYKKDNYEGKYN